MDVLIKIQRAFDVYLFMTLILIFGMYVWGFSLFSAENAFLVLEVLFLNLIIRMRTTNVMQGKVPFERSGFEEFALAPLYVLIGYGFMEYMNTKHFWQFLICSAFMVLMYIVAMTIVYTGKEENMQEGDTEQIEEGEVV